MIGENTMIEDYQCKFISAAANTIAHGTAWVEYIELDSSIHRSIIIYAASNFVAVVDNSSKTVEYTLRSNNVDDKITCLSSTYNPRMGCFVVVGYQSGALLVWHSFPVGVCQWRQISSADLSMVASVNTLSTLDSSLGLIISVFDSAGNAKIWKFPYSPASSLTLCQTMKFPPHQLPNSSHLTSLSNNTVPLLVTGVVDGKVNLYVMSDCSDEFHFVGSLIGHEEWVTCLSSKDIDNMTKFLASGSQDNKIRIWKITEHQSSQSEIPVVESKEQPLTGDEDDEEEEEEDGEESKKMADPIEDLNDLSSAEARFSFILGDKVYRVFLESLLVGHEDWVTNIHWLADNKRLQLFSTSMDRNMVIWSPSEDTTLSGGNNSGIWIPVVRVGDVGGALGGCIGGNLLGFIDGCVSPSSNAILGIGYGGSFHYWKKEYLTDKQEETDSRWYPVSFITGHFDSVNDLAWDPVDGRYLVSVSSDQTCRIFAPAKQQVKNCNENDSDRDLVSKEWREISRPEIHGYNLNCLALSKESFLIYTAGEEKMIRVFDAPLSVLRGFNELCDLNIPYDSGKRVEQAYIPELGLSNKGKDTMTADEKKELVSVSSNLLCLV
jgi:elongator complex protein 2